MFPYFLENTSEQKKALKTMSIDVIYFCGNFYLKQEFEQVWRDEIFIVGRYKNDVILLAECPSEKLATEGLKYLDWKLERRLTWD